jgi:hypothetical protein
MRDYFFTTQKVISSYALSRTLHFYLQQIIKNVFEHIQKTCMYELLGISQ